MNKKRKFHPHQLIGTIAYLLHQFKHHAKPEQPLYLPKPDYRKDWYQALNSIPIEVSCTIKEDKPCIRYLLS